MLSDKMVDSGIVASISHETVRKTLKKTSFARTSKSVG